MQICMSTNPSSLVYARSGTAGVTKIYSHDSGGMMCPWRKPWDVVKVKQKPREERQEINGQGMSHTKTRRHEDFRSRSSFVSDDSPGAWISTDRFRVTRTS